MFKHVRNSARGAARAAIGSAGSVITLALVGLLVSCGGGGSDDDGGYFFPTPIPVSPSSITKDDVYPQGTRSDFSALNLLPMAIGDEWVYAVEKDGQQGSQVTRKVLAASDAPGQPNRFDVYTESNGDNEIQTYVKDGSGLSVVGEKNHPLGSSVAYSIYRAELFQGVWPMKEFDEPFLPQGKLRKLSREGPLGLDLDADGTPESFRYVHEQIFQGFEPLTISGKALTVARFSSTETLVIRLSAEGNEEASVIGTEETYLAPQFGPVRIISELRDGAGAVLESRSVRTLASARVGTLDWKRYLSTDAAIKTLELDHLEVAYDKKRSLYYAAIPSNARAGANTVATINPTSGKISYSPALGLSPSLLALSEDGTTLYVASRASGEILQLALPSFAVGWRVNLRGDIRKIQTHPSNTNILAVQANIDGRNGVWLMEGGQLKAPNPRIVPTTLAFGSDDAPYVSFDASGTRLFGLGTVFPTAPADVAKYGGGSRIAVTEYAATASGLNFVGLNYDVDNYDLTRHLAIYFDMVRRNADYFSFTRVSTLPAPPRNSSCRLPWDLVRIVCTNADSNVLHIRDVNTSNILSTIRLGPDSQQNLPSTRIRAWGPPGQLWISLNDSQALLVDHPSLQ